MNPLQALEARGLISRCPLFRLSGVPVLWLFQAREGVMEALVKGDEQDGIDAINKVCEGCAYATTCFHDPDLEASRKELRRVYHRAWRLRPPGERP